MRRSHAEVFCPGGSNIWGAKCPNVTSSRLRLLEPLRGGRRPRGRPAAGARLQGTAGAGRGIQLDRLLHRRQHRLQRGPRPVNILGSSDLNGIVGGGQIGYNWQGSGSPWGSASRSTARPPVKTTVPPPPLSASAPHSDRIAEVIRHVPRPRRLCVRADVHDLRDRRRRLGRPQVRAHGGRFWLLDLGSQPARLDRRRRAWKGALNRNWSWKVEYLHLDTGSFNTNVVRCPAGVLAGDRRDRPVRHQLSVLSRPFRPAESPGSRRGFF